MQAIDTLIKARWVIPVIPEQTVLEHHALAIHAGRIIDILPISQADTLYDASRVSDLADHVLIPGLVNAHTHSAMSLFRGMADDLPLMEWLNKHIWPAESRWVDTHFVQDGTTLAIAEMLRGGTTCFADMYFFPDVIAKTAQATQIRACVGLIVLDFPTIWAQDANEYISKGITLHDEILHDPLITTLFAPHAPYTVSNEAFSKVRTLADELDIPIMCHVHETADEVKQALEQTGQTPLARLQALGLISPALLAVHMTQLEDSDIQLLADHGAHVIHCPESNMKLASGYCPASSLLAAGVNVALGTDGAASNNDLDMIGEMRSAALMAKNLNADATALPAFAALKMATLNGAKALGLDTEIGSLEKGKQADICAIDMKHLKTQPVYDPIAQIVYSADSSQVSDVWVAGKQVLRDRELLTIDVEKVLNNAGEWQKKISGQI